MIDGITVLSQEPILTENYGLAMVVGFFAFCGVMFIGLMLDWHQSVVGLLSSLAFVMAALLVFYITAEPTGRYRYEVTISPDVSVVDLLDRYDVTDRRGDIWIIEDKEIEK